MLRVGLVEEDGDAEEGNNKDDEVSEIPSEGPEKNVGEEDSYEEGSIKH